MRTVEPLPATGRIAALDVLRGVAILGTFASNAWLFAQPGGPAALLSGGGSFANDPVQAGLLVLSNGKFLALLTLLFGIGVEVQYRAAVRRGLPWPGRYPLRWEVSLGRGSGAQRGFQVDRGRGRGPQGNGPLPAGPVRRPGARDR